MLQKVLTFGRHQPDPGATAADAARSAGLVAGATTPGSQAGVAPTSRGPTVVALAFDRLSPEGRVLAVKAARAFIEDKQADELAGVFIVDQALAIVAPYTTDTSKLTKAIDRVSTTATTQMARDQRNTTLDAYYASSDVPWVAGAEEKGRASGQEPWVDPIAQAEQSGDHAQVAILQALMRMDRSYKDMLYEMQGQASINSLLALVDSLGSLEGRKAVIYFCEGLTIPPSVEPKYRAIIDNANRNNVTVYTLDSAGLRVQSKQAETAMGMNELGAMGVGDVRRGDKYLEGLEDNERYLKLDPAVSLGILASQTGGLLIDNTNDLARGIQKIDADRRNYYLLSYSPTNPSQDGSYRKLSVLVNRPGVEVRARSGYRATPRTDTGPTLSYETGALAALAVNPAPAEVPADIGAYSVPMPGRTGLSAVIANIPGSSLSFLKNDAGHAFSGEVVVLARVGGGTGELPRKLSQQYSLQGDLDNLPTTRSRRILFFRTADLSPGEHTVEVAVHDGPAKRNQVFRTTLRIPPPTRPVVGDLMIVDHAERLENGETAPGNPLVANQLALVPTYSPTLSRRERTDGQLCRVAAPRTWRPSAFRQADAFGQRGRIVIDRAAAPRRGRRRQALGRRPDPDRIHSRRSLRAGAHHRQRTIGADPPRRADADRCPDWSLDDGHDALEGFRSPVRPGVVQSRPRAGGVVLCVRGIAHDQRRRGFSWSDRDRGGGAILHDVIPGHGRHDGRCDHRRIAGDLPLDADRHQHGPWRHRQARSHQRLRGVDARTRWLDHAVARSLRRARVSAAAEGRGGIPMSRLL